MSISKPETEGLTIETAPAVRIMVSGEIDLANCGEFAAAIPTSGPVWLDFSGVTFVDSSGLRVLVKAQWAARKAGYELHVSGVHGGPLRAMETTGLYDLLCR